MHVQQRVRVDKREAGLQLWDKWLAGAAELLVDIGQAVAQKEFVLTNRLVENVWQP